jgi:hypothetical protein
VGGDSKSRVTGVYTSIPDLVHKGLRWSDEINGHGLKLTLVKPDTFDKPLGCWNGPEFPGMIDDLRAFIESHEISEEECNTLSSSLYEFVA